MMVLYSTDRTPLMEIHSFERAGDELLVKGKVFGTMPITARLTPEQTRAGLAMLNLKLIWFLLTLPFRRTSNAKLP